MTAVGKAAYSIATQSPDPINVWDLQKEMGKRLAKDLEETVERHKDVVSPYFIKLILRKQRTLPTNHIHYQVVAPYFAKPFPEYDTTLFKMDNKNGELQYLWTIPDQETCEYMLANQKDLSAEEQQLLSFVQRFSDGTLE